MKGKHPHGLRLKRLGIDTQQEAVVYMREDCHICRAEGFAAHARIRVAHGANAIVATLHHIKGDLLSVGDASLSEVAWRSLGAREGDEVVLSHMEPLESLSDVRTKIYGHRLASPAMARIIDDVAAGRYSDIHIAAFVTACSGGRLDGGEITALTRAMVDAGERLTWPTSPVVDKHCVGGLPGNRTTPIVVAIVTACGLTMPKTSSRAITSPAGTADTMETLAPVDLSLQAMRRVVEREGGCIVWGGAVHLSPADDALIRIERAIDLDGEGQLVASVLSKKVAAGSTHLVLDLPVGPTAKLRSAEEAERIGHHLLHTADELGIRTRLVVSDGTQPVGRGIGPALEARDVLAVLEGRPNAPEDLRRRGVVLAGALLELAGAAPDGGGEAVADEVLRDGRAKNKFERICEAQGGRREPPAAQHHAPIAATTTGRVRAIDNRRLARIAKLAGAPDAKAAGLALHVHVGDTVERSQPLFTVQAETPGELSYALDYARSHDTIITLEEA
jgi:thymidine phosphorylase